MGGAGTSTLTMVPGRPRSHLVEEVHTDDVHARLAELDHSASGPPVQLVIAAPTSNSVPNGSVMFATRP